MNETHQPITVEQLVAQKKEWENRRHTSMTMLSLHTALRDIEKVREWIKLFRKADRAVNKLDESIALLKAIQE